MYEQGEQVIWPKRFDATSAAAYIIDYTEAINIGALYVKEMQEETSHPIEAPSLIDSLQAAGSGAPELAPIHEEIRWIGPARPVATAHPKRKCISLKEYNSKKHCVTEFPSQGSAASSSHREADIVHHASSLDNPDAPFMEEDDL